MASVKNHEIFVSYSCKATIELTKYSRKVSCYSREGKQPINKVIRPKQVDSNALNIVKSNKLESFVAGLSPIR